MVRDLGRARVAVVRRPRLEDVRNEDLLAPQAGLADRVGALDGVLEVTSPPGEGTLLRAVLPL